MEQRMLQALSPRVVESGPAKRRSQVEEQRNHLALRVYQTAKSERVLKSATARRRRARAQRSKENAQIEMNRMLEQSFLDWRSFTREKQIKQVQALVADYHFETLLTLKAFSLWKLTLVERKWNQAITHHRTHLQKQILTSWKTVVLRRKCFSRWKAASLQSTAQLNRCLSKKRFAFQALRDNAVRRVSMRQKRLLLQRSVRDKVVLKTWHIWRQALFEREQEKFAARYCQIALGKKYILRWQRNVRSSVRLQALERLWLRRGFRELQTRMEKGRALERLLQALNLLKGTKAYRTKILVQSVSKWRKVTLWAQTSQQCKRLLIEIRNKYTLVQAKLVAVQHQLAQSRGTRVLRCIAAIHLRRALSCWRLESLRSQKLSALLSKQNTHILSNTLREWADVILHIKIVDKWTVLTAKAMLRVNTVQGKLNEHALRKNAALLATHFQRWKAFLRCVKDERRGVLERCWSAWSLLCAHRRVQMRMATKFRVKSQLRRCFCDWYERLMEARKIEFAEYVWKRNLMQRCFDEWQSFAKDAFLCNSRIAAEMHQQRLGWFGTIKFDVAGNFKAGHPSA